MNSIPLKRCRDCGKEFPETTEYFYTQVNRHLHSICKWCEHVQRERSRKERLLGIHHDRRRRNKTPKDFWDLVDIRGKDDCWEWLGSYANDYGYGRYYVDRQPIQAHRYAYILIKGDPGNLLVLHKCDNPGCVNPNHLFLGTYQDNVDDMFSKGRARPWGRPQKK